MATFLELYQSLDVDSQKRGKQFEHFVKWFLKNDPEWSTQVAQVWLWEEYPERWGVDCGIDLVFRHKNGENWAVQAKCYSPTYDITKHDVDKFLSESNRKGIDKRLLIASTDRIGKNAIQVCEAQEKQVVRLLLSDLDRAELEYPSCYEDLNTAKRKSAPTPRPHQLEAISAVADSFQGAERGQLIMACGTGKTFTTLWIKEKLASKRTLVLLPSLSLLSQTLREWTFAAKQPFDVLCVCSDETVGKRGEDEIIHSVAELAFPVTSSIDEIQLFLNGDGDKVIFSTYHSSPLVADAQLEQLMPAFDLVVADEAHRCTGKVSSAFATVLDNDRIIASKRLFATATPRTYTTSVKKVAEDRGIEVVGMDDEAVFGKVLYSLPFGEAIRKELLTDYRIVIIGVDNPMIADWIKNRELIKTDTGIENDAESMAAQIGLIKAIKDYDLKRIISFHNRVSRAESFKNDMHQVLDWISEEHRPTGELWTDFVSGAMPTDKRRQKLDYLKGLGQNQRGLLTNARCLSEGVDVPSLDAVAFIDPKSSQVDIVQAVGRAIRLSQDKKFGTIIIPVFIEHGDDAISSIEASNFKPVWEVLNAFKSHDEELSQQLDTLRTELGSKARSSVGVIDLTKITIDLPSSINSSFTDSIRTYLVEKTTETWSFWFGVLLKYTQLNGHSRVNDNYVTDEGYLLGKWVGNQKYRPKLLNADRIKKLESLPDWSWNYLEDNWNNNYFSLIEFSKNNSIHELSELGLVKLRNWVTFQKRSFSDSKLSPEQISKLEAVQDWIWQDSEDYRWDSIYQELTKYFLTHKTSLVPINEKLADGFKLGSWVFSQRQSYKKGSLASYKIERLNALSDWSWMPHNSTWDSVYKELMDYSETKDNCNVPNTYVCKNGVNLTRWIKNQKVKYRNKILENDRIERLNKLKGWYFELNDPNRSWEEIFEELKHKTLIEKSTLGSKSLSDFEDWIWSQKKRKSENKLSEDKISLLESIFNWTWEKNNKKKSWGDRYGQLVTFYEENGTTKVNDSYRTDDNFSLGTWIKTQRQNYKIGTINNDQKSLLSSLGDWSWDPNNEAWNLNYNVVLAYYNEYKNLDFNHSTVYKDFAIGSWSNKQRQKYKNKILDASKIALLEELPEWRWSFKDEAWEDGIEQLQLYIKEHGNPMVHRSYVSPDGFKLGTWVSYQRRSKTINLLSQDRIDRLEALSGWVWTMKKE